MADNELAEALRQKRHVVRRVVPARIGRRRVEEEELTERLLKSNRRRTRPSRELRIERSKAEVAGKTDVVDASPLRKAQTGTVDKLF